MLRTESPLNFDMVVKMDPQTNICMCCLKCSLLPSLHATAPPQRNGLLPPLVRCYLFSHAIAIFTKPALPACECSSDRAQSLLTSLPRWRGWQRSVDPLLSFQLLLRAVCRQSCPNCTLEEWLERTFWGGIREGAPSVSDEDSAVWLLWGHTHSCQEALPMCYY